MFRAEMWHLGSKQRIRSAVNDRIRLEALDVTNKGSKDPHNTDTTVCVSPLYQRNSLRQPVA